MSGPDRPRPIYSTLGEDPAHQGAIDRFVLGLAERVDELQDCDLRGDWARLAELAASLHEDGTRTGYDILARCAAAVCGSARERHPNDARKALIELTEVAQRVRLGHRGAA